MRGKDLEKHTKAGKKAKGGGAKAGLRWGWAGMGNVFDGESKRAIGAAIAVHRELGPGFLESTYAGALQVALRHRGVRFEMQCPVNVVFENTVVGVARIDLIVEGRVIVELKAVEALARVHFAQLRSYLRATGLHVGILLNFNSPTLVIRRIAVE